MIKIKKNQLVVNSACGFWLGSLFSKGFALFIVSKVNLGGVSSMRLENEMNFEKIVLLMTANIFNYRGIVKITAKFLS